MPLVPKVGSRLPAWAINEVGKTKTARDMSSARSFEKPTLLMKLFLKTCLRSRWLMDINDDAVDLVVGFIISEIAAIRTGRNTGKVTLLLLRNGGRRFRRTERRGLSDVEGKAAREAVK